MRRKKARSRCMVMWVDGFPVTVRTAGMKGPTQRDLEAIRDMARIVLKGGISLPRRVTMQPHQQRVVEEHADLEGKIKRLSDFQGGPIFDTLDQAEQARLKEQKLHMCRYRDVLVERIANFKDPEPPAPASEEPVELGTVSGDTKQTEVPSAHSQASNAT